MSPKRSNLPRISADFNGLFGEILCLSHEDSVLDENGEVILLCAGMRVMAFEPDGDSQGNRDDLVATGLVEPSPDWLQCKGSRWVLRIDAQGVRNQSARLDTSPG
jgi:hypothetical protein